jgi:transposase
MSPPALVRNVPYTVTSRGGPVEEDSDEHEGTSARRVLGRVKSKTLRLADAAKILELSYRQTKRLWKRYRGEGTKSLRHRSPGRGSNRAKPEEVLQLIRKRYSGTEQERFGATRAAEHSVA